jgi:hypothetical protein
MIGNEVKKAFRNELINPVSEEADENSSAINVCTHNRLAGYKMIG